MKHILVLCVGNICRSPLAHALLQKKLPDLVVNSAGLSAMIGYPADPKSVQLAAEDGIDISTHRAKQVTYELCQQADLILVMEQSHREELARRFPLVRAKVFCLGTQDISDPYKMSIEVFRMVYGEIIMGVDRWVTKIKQIA